MLHGLIRKRIFLSTLIVLSVGVAEEDRYHTIKGTGSKSAKDRKKGVAFWFGGFCLFIRFCSLGSRAVIMPFTKFWRGLKK